MSQIDLQRPNPEIALLSLDRPEKLNALSFDVVEENRTQVLAGTGGEIMEAAASFSAGCPLVAAAADTAATNEHLRTVLQRAFDGWLEPLSEGLAYLGVPPERSDGLANVMISALEGAIIMARIRRDLTQLDALVGELGPASR